jgi:hypothetical protein
VQVDDAGAALLALGRAARAALTGPGGGVTGSAGKTTTKALLAAALDAHASPGNLNTPHALATVLVDAWLAGDPTRPLVLELGIDRRGEMAELTDLVRPTHGLVTLIAEAHLAGLGDLAQVAHEKAGVLRAATVAGYAPRRPGRLPPPLRAASGATGSTPPSRGRDAPARRRAGPDRTATRTRPAAPGAAAGRHPSHGRASPRPRRGRLVEGRDRRAGGRGGAAGSGPGVRRERARRPARRGRPGGRAADGRWRACASGSARAGAPHPPRPGRPDS